MVSSAVHNTGQSSMSQSYERAMLSLLYPNAHVIVTIIQLFVYRHLAEFIPRLLDCTEPTGDKAAIAIENIADAVTHARFVGTDPGSDEVVLMKILHVRIFFLRTVTVT